MYGGDGGMALRHWILTDKFGQRWRLTLFMRRAPPSMPARASGPAAILDALVEDAFAPWGSGRRENLEDLREIYAALGGRDLSPEHRLSRRGETDWRARMETVRTVLLDAVEIGWLLRGHDAIDSRNPGGTGHGASSSDPRGRPRTVDMVRAARGR